AVGSVVILTASRWFAGLSCGSVNPKSPVVNVCAVSSAVVIVLSAPAGASFTEATSTARVDVAVATLLLVSGSPSTCSVAVAVTWKSTVPVKSGGGFNVGPSPLKVPFVFCRSRGSTTSEKEPSLFFVQPLRDTRLHSGGGAEIVMTWLSDPSLKSPN